MQPVFTQQWGLGLFLFNINTILRSVKKLYFCLICQYTLWEICLLSSGTTREIDSTPSGEAYLVSEVWSFGLSSSKQVINIYTHQCIISLCKHLTWGNVGKSLKIWLVYFSSFEHILLLQKPTQVCLHDLDKFMMSHVYLSKTKKCELQEHPVWTLEQDVLLDIVLRNALLVHKWSSCYHWLYKNIQIEGNYLTLLKRKARPVAPVKRVEMSSERLVRIVSQLAHEKRRVPPMWSKKIRPIVLQQRKQPLRMCSNICTFRVGKWEDGILIHDSEDSTRRHASQS